MAFYKRGDGSIQNFIRTRISATKTLKNLFRTVATDPCDLCVWDLISCHCLKGLLFSYKSIKKDSANYLFEKNSFYIVF